MVFPWRTDPWPWKNPTAGRHHTCLNSVREFINDDWPLLLEHSLSNRTGKSMQTRMFALFSFERGLTKQI